MEQAQRAAPVPRLWQIDAPEDKPTGGRDAPGWGWYGVGVGDAESI